MRNLARFFIRVFAFVGKEIATILRQPRLVFTLILGPFFILLIFGIGYRNTARTLKTVFVVPEQETTRALINQYADNLGQPIEFVGITADEAEATAKLRSQEVDLVVVTPVDPLGNLRDNKQSTFHLYHYEIDPFEETYIRLLGREYTNVVNEEVLIAMADQGKVEAESFQVKLGQAKEQTTAVRHALEDGDAAQAVHLAQTLNDDIGLLALGVGSGLALFSSVDKTMGTGAEAGLIEDLENLQVKLLEMQQMDTGKESFDVEIETAVSIEQDLDHINTILNDYRTIDSRVLVSPFRSEADSITSAALQPTHFFVPAVIALLLQHIAITLGGLSIVRERRDGAL